MKKNYLFIVALLISVCTFAEGTRAYVNMETLFDGFYKTVAANLAFEDRKDEVENQLDLIRKELESINKEAQKFDADFRNELLSKDAREAAARKLQTAVDRLRIKQREYERARAENYQMLQQLRLTREDELVAEILKTVYAIADEHKAEEVIEVSGKTMNRVAVFLRYPKQGDITQEALKRLNQGHEQELQTAQAELKKRLAAAEEQGNQNK